MLLKSVSGRSVGAWLLILGVLAMVLSVSQWTSLTLSIFIIGLSVYLMITRRRSWRFFLAWALYALPACAFYIANFMGWIHGPVTHDFSAAARTWELAVVCGYMMIIAFTRDWRK